jgi:hypothetical protein
MTTTSLLHRSSLDASRWPVLKCLKKKVNGLPLQWTSVTNQMGPLSQILRLAQSKVGRKGVFWRVKSWDQIQGILSCATSISKYFLSFILNGDVHTRTSLNLLFYYYYYTIRVIVDLVAASHVKPSVSHSLTYQQKSSKSSVSGISGSWSSFNQAGPWGSLPKFQERILERRVFIGDSPCTLSTRQG